jgi:hypothetical protein
MTVKKPVSVTLDPQNVLWLKAQAAALPGRTASSIVDELVTDARLRGRINPAAVRSVAGTIDLSDSDPELKDADAYVRSVFDQSIRRPWRVKDARARDGTKSGRRRG